MILFIFMFTAFTVGMWNILSKLAAAIFFGEGLSNSARSIALTVLILALPMYAFVCSSVMQTYLLIITGFK